MTIDIVTRKQWGARSPKRAPNRIVTPTPELWLHHTAGSHAGPAGMRQIQNFHIDGRGWSDIAYSYCVDPADLVIYEGRGAGIQGGHTFGRNSVSHGICVFGNFDRITGTDALLDRIAELVRHGHDRGWWPAALTGGHRDVRSTDCPGDWLYARIKTINNRTGGTIVPPDPNAPNPYVKQIQQAVLRAGYKLPEFGDDGFVGPETVAAVERMSADTVAYGENVAQLRIANREQQQRIGVLEQQLQQAERSAAAGDLFRRAIIALEA